MEPYNRTTDLFAEEPVMYGGFWQRFGALFIDSLVVGAAVLLLGFVFRDNDPESLDLRDLVNVVIGWLYYALQESSPSQATLGKKALGLKVTTVSGNRINFAQATGRYFGKVISSLILLIGYLMMLWDAKKQTLHDKMANTLVITTPE